MYGTPALPPDFVSLPYTNPDAPKGGRVVFGNTGGFDSLNPFVLKGTAPWQLRFWGYESLMGRSWDEPFTLYGLLAESVETAPDRTWAEFTLRPEARFSDGSPVTVEDVIWSYEILGTRGHPRYRGLWSQIDSIRQTGPRSLRISFNQDNRELALIAGLRPILQKAQWENDGQTRDFAASGLDEIPIGTGAYVVADFEAGRYVSLRRNPDYWGRNLPFRRGTQNFDELRIEFYGDQTVLFEAFKAGKLSVMREFNAEKWRRQYDFPAVLRGDVVKSEIPHQRPTGMTGFVMNTRRAQFSDWRVRQAMLLAFNFESINDTMTGGVQPRITSYFANSSLGMRPGAASGRVRALLAPFAAELPPGALEGYALPVGDGTARNRKNLRRAVALLAEAGWSVRDGQLRNAEGQPFAFEVLLRQGDGDMQTVIEIYTRALARLGMRIRVSTVDNAQYAARETSYDFDMTTFRRDLSLSPGNEQKLYWGRTGVTTEGSRNLMGMDSPAAEAMIDAMLSAKSRADFTAAVRALDRVLTAGRYVIPIWRYDVGRIAHARQLRFPDKLPIYGDRLGFLPDVWWYQPD
jgi:peptide/nickel transport system substrate-binding protein